MVGDSLPARGDGSGGLSGNCLRVAATPHGGGFRCAASGDQAGLREPVTLSVVGAPLMPSILESAELWHASLSRDGVSVESGDSTGRLPHLIEIGLVTELGYLLRWVRSVRA